jgi:hypothetical protein
MPRVATQTVAGLKAHMQLRGSAVSLPVFERQEKKGRSNSVEGRLLRRVDRVKALIACHVFPVADRPVAGDSADRVKGAVTLT